MVVFLHRPELLLFALDLHHEMGGETVGARRGRRRRRGSAVRERALAACLLIPLRCC